MNEVLFDQAYFCIVLCFHRRYIITHYMPFSLLEKSLHVGNRSIAVTHTHQKNQMSHAEFCCQLLLSHF